jgi:hypothetical protein
MKKYKLELAIVALILLFVIILMWQTLSVATPILPIALVSVCVLFLLFLYVPIKTSKNASQIHEAYAPTHFAKVALSSFLGIAIAIVVAVILNKNNLSKTFDLTTNHVNSLSPETTKFLDSLGKQVEIICVPSRDPAENYCASTIDLVNLYAKYSKNIINIGVLNMANKTLIQRLQPSGFSRLILITDNNKSEIDGNITESKITNAIVNLVKFKKTVYFLSGSGEPSLKAGDTERNYNNIVGALSAKAYEVKEWNIRQGELPSDAKVLVAGDNIITYGAEVENMLTKFVARGGKLVLIVNPYREQGLKNFYKSIHLSLSDTLLTLNKNTTLGKQIAEQNLTRPPVILSNFSSTSPITQVIAQIYSSQAAVPIDGGRPIQILNSPQDSPVKTNASVLMTSFDAAPITLTESARNKIDLNAPFTLSPDKNFNEKENWTLGVSVNIENSSKLYTGAPTPADAKKDKSQVVVYGFSLVNMYSASSPISEELIPLTVATLYQDEELISVPKRDFEPKHFHYERNPGAWLLLFAGILPVLTAITGFAIWMKRRSA